MARNRIPKLIREVRKLQGEGHTVVPSDVEHIRSRAVLGGLHSNNAQTRAYTRKHLERLDRLTGRKESQ